MFNNIGNKIKALTKVIAIVGMILWGIIALVIIIAGAVAGSFIAGLIVGILVAVAGCLIVWINSFVMYAYGELVSNAADACKDIASIKGELHEIRNLHAHHHATEKAQQKAEPAPAAATPAAAPVVTPTPATATPTTVTPIVAPVAVTPAPEKKAPEKRVCPQCGNTVAGDQQFCSNCGCRV